MLEEALEDIRSYKVPPPRYSQEDIDAMKMWFETGCVPAGYMERVLGSPCGGVTLSPDSPPPRIIVVNGKLHIATGQPAG